jgi:hypothetical protein
MSPDSDSDFIKDPWGDTLVECERHPGCYSTIDFPCPKCVDEEE